jgi:TatD DNase family protein
MSIPFVDIHTHHPVYEEDVISVPSLFLQDIATNQTLKSPFTAGIHPWHADKLGLDEIKMKLQHLITQHELVAIGETGLDKKCQVDIDVQKTVFELHIELAKAIQKPLIIHCVNSWDEIIRYSKKKEIPFILHGYRGNVELTSQLIHHGFCFSLGKAILNGNQKLEESLRIIPPTSLFFETDDDLADIKIIYNAAALILSCSLEDLKRRVFENYNLISQKGLQ